MILLWKVEALHRLCSFTLKYSENSALPAFSGMRIRPVWVLCLPCCPWFEFWAALAGFAASLCGKRVAQIMYLFHSLKQKTRNSNFHTYFMFEFAQLQHPAPQNIQDTTFTGDPNSCSISCGHLVWFYLHETGTILKEIPIYWRCFLFQSFPLAIVLYQSPLPFYSLVLT